MNILPRTVAFPTREPVTLEQLRRHVIVDNGVDDALLRGYLAAARSHVETVLGRPIVPRPVRATFYDWPERWYWPATGGYGPITGGCRNTAGLTLLLPLVSVDVIAYTAADGTVTPWLPGPAGWIARTSPGEVTHVRPAAAASWPVLGADAVITLDATAGYAAVPPPIVEAILLLAGHFFANRESVIVSDGRAIVAEVPQTVKALLTPHRWQWLG